MSEKRADEESRFWARFAARYDGFMERRVKSYDTLIEKILHELNSDWTVLEVAAGTGVIALRLAQKVKKVYASDITPEMIAKAEEKAKRQGVRNIVCSVDDAYALPFADRSFDAVVCANALHVMQQPKRALAEMRRVLAPSGLLIAPTLCHGQNLKTHLISRVMALTGFPAYQRLGFEGVRALVGGSGFVVEKSEIIPETIPMAFIVARKG